MRQPLIGSPDCHQRNDYDIKNIDFVDLYEKKFYKKENTIIAEQIILD